MGKTICIAKIDADKVIISNLNEDDVNIDISGDVDFTNVVSILSECIDEDKEFDLEIEEEDSIEEEKQKLIIQALKNIFDEYQECIEDDDEQEDEYVPEAAHDDDLPF